MNEQEQKIAKSIIGTLVFVIAFLVFYVVGLPSLAVSYANPNLSSGPFDLWTMAMSLLAPVAAAYLVVSTKIGAGVISLVAMIISRIMQPDAPQAIAPEIAKQLVTRDELEAYAKKSEVVATLKKNLAPIQQQIDKQAETIQAWESQ
jgi:hypothetical protein